MKTAVIYSSETGNTKKVAEAIRAAMPEGAELHAIEDAPPPAAYDLLVIGFWVDKGVADAKASAYMKTITNKKVFSFFTLGADPASPHAKSCADKAPTFYGADCEHLGAYYCQGAVAPKLIDWMKQLPADHPHGPNEERLARWAEAAKHPDQADLEAAAAAIKLATAVPR